MPERIKIKVVHLITLLELGGAQGNTIHTVLNLDPNRYETHLWAGPGGFWDKDVRSKLDASNRLRFFPHLKRYLHPLFDLMIVWDLVRALRQLKPDVLHTHSSKAGIVGRLAGWIAGTPKVIHTYHGFGFNPVQKPWTYRLFVLLEKFSARLADRLIFVSLSNIETARRLGLGRPESHMLIRSGVPLEKIKKEKSETDPSKLRHTLGLKDERVILTVGPFKPQKNLRDFIEMAALVCKRTPNVRFLIVGDGHLRSELERLIISRNLTQVVKLLGWRSDVASILSVTDVFVMTSLWEGLPRSLVESLALGVPSVCYDTDGVRDLLKQGGGIMVPPRSVESAAESVQRLLTDPGLHATLSGEAIRMIGEDFDIDAMVRQQDDLYQTLLD